MNNELYHYGVKGMKWGVRRAEKQVKSINKYHKKSIEESQRSRVLSKMSDNESKKGNGSRAREFEDMAKSSEKSMNRHINKTTKMIDDLYDKGYQLTYDDKNRLYSLYKTNSDLINRIDRAKRYIASISEGFKEGMKEGAEEGRREAELKKNVDELHLVKILLISRQCLQINGL